MTSFLRTGGPTKTARPKVLFSTREIAHIPLRARLTRKEMTMDMITKQIKKNRKDEIIDQNLDEDNNDPNDGIEINNQARKRAKDRQMDINKARRASTFVLIWKRLTLRFPPTFSRR
eukprot:1205454-Heterocapsa_arctica.AAC.2